MSVHADELARELADLTPDELVDVVTDALGARVGIGWEPASGDGLSLKVVVVPMGEAGRLILGPCPCESW